VGLGAVVVREKEFPPDPAQAGPQPGVVLGAEGDPVFVVTYAVKIRRVVGGGLTPKAIALRR